MVSTFLHNKGSILSYDSNQNITNSFHEKGHKAFAPFGAVNVCLSPQGKPNNHQRMQVLVTGSYRTHNTRARFFRV